MIYNIIGPNLGQRAVTRVKLHFLWHPRFSVSLAQFFELSAKGIRSKIIMGTVLFRIVITVWVCFVFKKTTSLIWPVRRFFFISSSYGFLFLETAVYRNGRYRQRIKIVFVKKEPFFLYFTSKWSSQSKKNYITYIQYNYWKKNLKTHNGTWIQPQNGRTKISKLKHE